MEEKELVAWIERRVRALDRVIAPDDASYMIFLCGNDMTNLAGEIDKAAAHSTTGEIKNTTSTRFARLYWMRLCLT